jgi:hypothetical protein
MRFRQLTFKQQLLWTLRHTAFVFAYIPIKIGNWATNKLNKSYYK